MEIPELMDILLFIGMWFVIMFISALVYREMYYRGATKQRYIKKFDLMISQTALGQAVIHLSETIKAIQTKVTEIDSKSKEKFTEFGTTLDGKLEKVTEIKSSLEGKLDNLYNKIRGAIGGHIKVQSTEAKELMGDLAAVTAVEYPGLSWVNDNLNMLTELGLVEESWGEKYRVLANYPQMLPPLEKAAIFIKAKFDKSDSNTNKQGGKGRNFKGW